ncbi:hypothetical protein HSBAA_36780 [Vreelandella sulfidaeris]|uniref:Uncharacterized protein n=1 Tax=Vreelandella sulfidaeris TaxID=115553 RepID=A0A455U8A2_9GAMM|nr:hypothetical protein HSBAA_36780 [Halomonas sulfidaeris]
MFDGDAACAAECYNPLQLSPSTGHVASTISTAICFTGSVMTETSSSSATPSLSYKDAGVDIDAGNALVDRIKHVAKRTTRQSNGRTWRIRCTM